MKLGLKPCTTNSARPGAAGRSGRAGAAHVYRDHPVARKSCFPGEWVRLGPPRAPPRPALPAIPASRPRDAARDAHVRGRPGRPGAARDGARGDQRGVQSTGNVLLRRTGVRPEPPRASPRPVPRPRAKAEACSRRAFCGPGTGAAWRGRACAGPILLESAAGVRGSTDLGRYVRRVLELAPGARGAPDALIREHI